MRSGLVVVTALMLAALADAQSTSPAEVGMWPAVEYPSAGVTLAVPKSFTPQAPAQMLDIMAATQMGADGTPTMALTLTIMPVNDPKAELDTIARRVIQQQAANIAIRKLEVLKTTQMPVAGQMGAARLIRYTFRGVERFSARVFFVRELPTPGMRLAYVLTVEASEVTRQQLLPVLGEVVKTIQMIPFVPAAQLPLGTASVPLADPAGHFLVGVPVGWFAQPTGGGLELGQIDFITSQPVRRAALVVRPVSGLADLEQLTQKDCQSTMQMGQQRGLLSQVNSIGASQMLGAKAWQFVVEQNTPEPTATATSQPESAAATGTQPATTTAPAPKRHKVVIAQRMTTIPAPSGEATMSVAVFASDIPAEQVVQDLEQLVASVQLAPPTTAPAGSTAPAASPAPPATTPAAPAATTPAPAVPAPAAPVAPAPAAPAAPVPVAP